MTHYWSQFDKEELDAMHGIEEFNDHDPCLYSDDEDIIEDEEECPKCRGGCNYCLMLQR